MPCKDSKDWFNCYVVKGVDQCVRGILLAAAWILWAIITPVCLILVAPLAFLGWLLEGNDDED